MTPTPPTLVLGFGNASLSDDGIGVRAIEYLRPRLDSIPTVRVLDGGTSIFEVLGHFKDSERLIVVDAAELGAVPGTIRCFIGAAMDHQLGQARRTAHEVALRDLFDMARLQDMLPDQRALVGIQPRSVGWGAEPSGELMAALPALCDRVLDLIRAWPSAKVSLPA